jgi:hypothetical protein
MKLGLRAWQLFPGMYAMRSGAVTPGERPGQYRYAWGPAKDVQQAGRAFPIGLEIPPHQEWVVDLRLRRPIDRPAVLADLAVAPRDIRREADRLVVTVHNIGGAPAGQFVVTLEEKGSQGWKQLGRHTVTGLPAIQAFEPVRQEITFPVEQMPKGTQLRALLDPVNDIEEMCEFNNCAEIGG